MPWPTPEEYKAQQKQRMDKLSPEEYKKQFEQEFIPFDKDACLRCGGQLHERETGPNPSWKCRSCGTIQ